MKKKFLAILLGALMLVSMIPATGMAAAAPINLVPNGDFEDDFVTTETGDVPTAAWTNISGTNGTISKVASDGDITPYSGSSFVKIDRNATGYSAGMTGFYWPISGLETGTLYTFSFAYNLPTDLPDYSGQYNGLYVRSASQTGTAMQNKPGSAYATFYNLDSERAATDGWQKEELTFYYDGTTAYLFVGVSSRTTACVAYIDAISIVEATSAASEIIPNGDFEIGFYNGVPSPAWTNKTAEGNGTISRVTQAGDITAYSGEGFMKIDRTASGYSSGVTGVYWPVSGLTVGNYYKFSFAYNIPTALPNYSNQNNGLYVRAAGDTGNSMANYPAASYARFYNMAAERDVTDGWATDEVVFKYDGRTAYIFMGLSSRVTACVAYLDAFKLEPVAFEDVPAQSILPSDLDGTFTDAEGVYGGTDGKYFFNSRAVVGTNYDIVADPTNASNNVVKIYGFDHAREQFFFPNRVTDGQNAAGDTVKIAFRMYVEVDASKVEDFSNVILLKYASDNMDNTNKYSRSGWAFNSTNVNRWVDVVIYAQAYRLASDKLALDPWTATDDTIKENIYIDDVVMETVVAGEIANFNADARVAINTENTDSTRTWLVGYIGEKNATLTKTSKFMPVVRFASDTTSANGIAYAIAAVYKVDNGVRTLVDVKIEDLKNVAPADAAGVTDLGFTSPDFYIDLGAKDLADGTYEAKCFVWNVLGLAPVYEATYTLN
ncbi:MAG: hypothetical protein IJN74_05470 [Clostridia bacterium]|nr:hypothetical protein [Clostridia bacterium]